MPSYCKILKIKLLIDSMKFICGVVCFWSFRFKFGQFFQNKLGLSYHGALSNKPFYKN